MQKILDARSIKVRYGSVDVLRDVSFSVNEGEVLGLMGPNGAGKSTLIRIASGVERQSGGEVIFNGENIAKMAPREVARNIAAVHQASQFPFPVNSLDVVLMGLWPYMPSFGFESEKEIELAMDAMKTCDCERFARRDVNTLSGGERQRVMIARALAQDPRLLLLDEPTAFLDLGHIVRLKELIKKLVSEKNMSVVCAVHDLSFAAATCDRVLLLGQGTVVAEGKTAEVLTGINIETAFGINGYDA